MSKSPAVQFYTADFLVGADDMTNAQCGAYIRLLCKQHQGGHIPEAVMKRVCGGYDAMVFGKFTIDEDGLYYNERMEAEIEKRDAFIDKQRERGKKRWGGDENDTTEVVNDCRGNAAAMPRGGNATAMPSNGHTAALPGIGNAFLEDEDEKEKEDVKEKEISNEVNIKTTESTERTNRVTAEPPKNAKRLKNQSKGRSAADFVPPDHLAEDWAEFVEMRNRLKGKCVNTYHALDLIVRKMEELAPNNHEAQVNILRQSIVNGWVGVFPLNNKFSQRGNGGSRYGPQEVDKGRVYNNTMQAVNSYLAKKNMEAENENRNS